MGNGCCLMGLPTLRPTFICINICIGEVSERWGEE
jgi:hypothetical protein